MIPSTPPAVLKARILGTVAAMPSPTRRAHLLRASVLVACAVSVSFTVFFLAGGIRVTGRPLSLLVGTVLGTGVISTVASYVALGRGNSMMGRPRVWLLAVALASP